MKGYIDKMKREEDFICIDCIRLKECREDRLSWVFFTIALIATIAIRAVNLAHFVNPWLGKAFWYLGVGGFSIYFLYKFKKDHKLHREIESSALIQKLFDKEKLTDREYYVLGTILCRLSSKKDKVNYFFIFFFSGIALILAIYFDFIN